MPTEKFTKTVICPLETSQRKNDRLRRLIDEWQEIAGFYANRIASFPEWKWGGHTDDTTGVFYKPIKEDEFGEVSLYADDMKEAMFKVSSAYGSWKSTGKAGNHPKGEFGDGDYIRMNGSGDDSNIQIVENDRGFGVKAKMEPRKDDEWFHIRGGEYQYEILDEVVNGDMKYGTGEFHLDPDTGSLALHLSVSTEIEIPKVSSVDHYVGVDIGQNAIFALAAVDDDGDLVEIEPGKKAEIEPGGRFYHHRNRLQQKIDHLQEQGNLKGYKEKRIRNQRHNFTEQELDTYSRRIVDIASSLYPAVIALEELTGAREALDNHDWPYGELQEKITYKAKEARIPVKKIDASFTSQECRKCGHTDEENRYGIYFTCQECGYEVHADFNAAINIARSI